MTLASARDFDRRLSEIPLFVRGADGGLLANPEREAFIARWAEEHGVALQVPYGARLLGCRNCRLSDRLRHPEQDEMYCPRCPVLRLRRRVGVP